MKRLWVFILIFLWCGAATVPAEEPWSVSEHHPATVVDRTQRAEAKIQKGWLAFYQDWISSSYGPRCPMHPTCSAYCAHSFREYGFVAGWLMTADRLLHEGAKMDHFRLQWIHGRARYVDLPRDNAPWWGH